MGLLGKRTVQASERDEPTLKNYLKSMNEFVAEAKADPGQDYLLNSSPRQPWLSREWLSRSPRVLFELRDLLARIHPS